MQHKGTLLVDGLDGHEPHCRSGDGFANRFCISGIVFLSLHVRLHVSGRHQATDVIDKSFLCGFGYSRLAHG